MSKAANLTGMRFGWLTAKERVENDVKGRARWRCLCECGTTFISDASPLTRGNTKSCGCKRSLRMKTMHARNGRGHRASNATQLDDLEEFLSS